MGCIRSEVKTRENCDYEIEYDCNMKKCNMIATLTLAKARSKSRKKLSFFVVKHISVTIVRTLQTLNWEKSLK